MFGFRNDCSVEVFVELEACMCCEALKGGSVLSDVRLSARVPVSNATAPRTLLVCADASVDFVLT